MISNDNEAKDLIITAKQAQEWSDSILRNILRLREATWDSGMGDKWLDRQFVITKGNLRDLSRMFSAMAEVKARKMKEVSNGKNETN